MQSLAQRPNAEAGESWVGQFKARSPGLVGLGEGHVSQVARAESQMVMGLNPTRSSMGVGVTGGSSARCATAATPGSSVYHIW